MIVVAIIGILAAIAIPNFMRYQLRAKVSELNENLTSIFKSEEAMRQSERQNPAGLVGQYWAFANVPTGVGCTAAGAGIPCTNKLPWEPADIVVARKIDWAVEGNTYGRYSAGTNAFPPVADDSGLTLTVQAQSDVDGDGAFRCVALFKPLLASNGTVATAAQNATCAGGTANPTITAASTPPAAPFVADESVF
jgi:type IV pilus assembly protein PilA